MDVTNLMSAQDTSRTQMQVDTFNKSLGDVAVSENLGKDEFMKILIAQLTHQDPTEPMKDTEFIAQMAQFSTLEQITNMTQDFGKLAGILSSSQALGLLGKSIELIDGGQVVSGIVEEVSGREAPMVLVNGKYYDFAKVDKIRE
jgi:flagellar basal-body rod modification protein FlgD